jgi:hypothetical protein
MNFIFNTYIPIVVCKLFAIYQGDMHLKDSPDFLQNKKQDEAASASSCFGSASSFLAFVISVDLLWTANPLW